MFNRFTTEKLVASPTILLDTNPEIFGDFKLPRKTTVTPQEKPIQLSKFSDGILTLSKTDTSLQSRRSDS